MQYDIISYNNIITIIYLMTGLVSYDLIAYHCTIWHLSHYKMTINNTKCSNIKCHKIFEVHHTSHITSMTEKLHVTSHISIPYNIRMTTMFMRETGGRQKWPILTQTPCAIFYVSWFAHVHTTAGVRTIQVGARCSTPAIVFITLIYICNGALIKFNTLETWSLC